MAKIGEIKTTKPFFAVALDGSRQSDKLFHVTLYGLGEKGSGVSADSPLLHIFSLVSSLVWEVWEGRLRQPMPLLKRPNWPLKRLVRKARLTWRARGVRKTPGCGLLKTEQGSRIGPRLKFERERNEVLTHS